MNCYKFEELTVGKKEEFSVNISEEMLTKFKDITGDINPLHNDETYAISLGHKGRVAYGMLTSAFLSTLAGVYLPGEKSLIQTVEIKMEKPVYIGDLLTVTGEITEVNDTFRFIIVKALIKNQDGKKVLKANMRIGVSE